ncbi:MAG: efflux transporter outer membrane subunit [Hyphomonadaceae bacterium]|nr:efflux transporter outer membrane subunit [Hyphomonadaceae bacterium]
MSALALGACSTMPRERPTAPALPTVWQDAPQGAETPVSDWWRSFNDPTLDALVAEALSNGPSVRIALARVREARALSRTTIAQYLPELQATGRGQYTRAVDGDIASSTEREQMTGTYGAQVSWEVPLFARIEAAVLGGRATTQGAVADVRAAQVALAADIAQAYVDLRAAQQSRAALERAVQTADELARILAISAQAGITSEADAADARRLAESTRVRLPGLVIEQRRAENVLAVLRGLAPGTEAEATRAALSASAAVPFVDLTSAPAAPADLLRLRPDIARAEAQALLAATNVADARANLLPRLNLTGLITSSEAIIGNPTGAGSTLINATPVISIPLFDWGSRLAQVRQRNAQFDQSLIQYQQTVTQAVAEASNALVGLDQGRLRLQSARVAEQAAETTARGSRAAYGAGIQSLADRLRSEQQLIDANLTRIDAEAQLARSTIATYRAFGGGPAVEAAQPR